MSAENDTAGTKGSETPTTPSAIRSPVAWFWRMQDSRSRSAPIARTLWAAILLVAGVAGSELYGWARAQLFDPDAYLKELAAKQDESFKELKSGLRELSGAVGTSQRDALARVEAVSTRIHNANAGLMRQLELAKEENSRLSQVAGRQAGVKGGYDFLLSEHTGLVLDTSSVFGVHTIDASYVSVNLSANGAPEGTKSLRSGQSLSYVAAGGTQCKVTLLSISGRSGAASFSKTCV